MTIPRLDTETLARATRVSVVLSSIAMLALVELQARIFDGEGLPAEIVEWPVWSPQSISVAGALLVVSGVGARALGRGRAFARYATFAAQCATLLYCTSPVSIHLASRPLNCMPTLLFIPPSRQVVALAALAISFVSSLIVEHRLAARGAVDRPSLYPPARRAEASL